MSDTGEKVLWSNLERVDLEDMDAVSELGQSNLAKSFGALLDNYSGDETSPPPRGGLLSKLDYDGANPAIVTFGPMTICYAPNGPGGATDHGPMAQFRYDRNQAHQASASTPSLDFQGRVRPFVWARRIPTTTDEEPRRFWDEVNEVEFTDVVFTRERDVVELALSDEGDDTSPPLYGTGWVRIARVVSIGTEVVLSPRHAFDGYDATYEASSTNETRAVGARFYPEEPVVDTSRRPGIPELVRYLIAALCKVHDGQWNFDENSRLNGNPIAGLRGWRHGLLDTAFRGLRQLQGENDITTAREAELGGERVVYAGNANISGADYTFDDATATLTGAGAAVTVSNQAFGAVKKLRIVIADLPAGFELTSLQVTNTGTYPIDVADNPYITHVGISTALPFIGDGATDITIEVGFFYKDVGDVNPNDWTPVKSQFSLVLWGVPT